MKPKVYVTCKLPERVLDYLGNQAELEIHTGGRQPTREEIVSRVRDKHALICTESDRVDGEMIRSWRDLKVIASIGATVDHLDLRAATECGISVTRTPGVFSESAADLIWALMLNLAFRLKSGFRVAGSGRHVNTEIPVRDVYGATLGLIGMGMTGQAVARRAAGFRMNVCYWSSERLEPETEKWLGLQYLPFEQVLGASDFVCVHGEAAERSSPRPAIFDKSRFALMKPTAMLIYAAPGNRLDGKALLEALRSNEIAGAGVVVRKNETFPEPELECLDQAVLTPDLTGEPEKARTKAGIMAANNILSYFLGLKPPNLVNREAWKPPGS